MAEPTHSPPDTEESVAVPFQTPPSCATEGAAGDAPVHAPLARTTATTRIVTRVMLSLAGLHGNYRPDEGHAIYELTQNGRIADRVRVTAGTRSGCRSA